MLFSSIGAFSLEDVEVDDDEPKPLGSGVLGAEDPYTTDYSKLPIPNGTPCYFCDYQAHPPRLRSGHPVCDHHRKRT